MLLALSLVLLAGCVIVAIVRPKYAPEGVVGVIAALIVLAVGAVSWDHAVSSTRELLPVVLFLAAALALSESCRREGLFAAVGSMLQQRAHGRATRLYALTFITAALVTAALSLDATVVLLTPVILQAAAKARVHARPAAYATGHLANSASLLLPVSNLTNLLAFKLTGLTFLAFAAHMVLPWIAVLIVEFVVLRLLFRRDFAPGEASEEPVAIPRLAATVVVLVLVGFAVTSPLGIEPAWVAGAGALVLVVRELASRRVTVREVVGSLNLSFCIFVLGLGVVVDAVGDTGLSSALSKLLPDSQGFWSLLLIAMLAALLANVVNNLPATLLLLPLVAPLGVDALLAMLIGVNVGPNLTYSGSLATLLWRRVLQKEDQEVALPVFTRAGMFTVLPAIVAATAALWLV